MNLPQLEAAPDPALRWNSGGFFRTVCAAWILLAVLWAGLAAPALGQEAAVAGATGSIRGIIKDEDFGDPLENARITVQELNVTVTTKDGGNYVIENVPPGVYTLSVAKGGYTRKLRTEVLVRPGVLSDVNEDLAAEIFEMEEIVVQAEDLLGGTETGLLELRQESASLVDSVSSDLLSKAAASDAADAVKLVVGVTVSEDKGAVVRGLGDRYTVTTLNNARIPSPNPSKRTVELDLFPTSIIQSIQVSKAFTPDMQGEATGGAVNIVTKAIPDGPILEVSGSAGYDSNATGNSKFRTYEGAGEALVTDFDGSRDIPDGAYPDKVGLGSNAQRSKRTRSFAPVMGTTTKTPEPNQSYSIALGNKIEIDKDQAFGALFNMSYGKNYDFIEGGTRVERRNQAGGAHSNQLENAFTYDEGKEETAVNIATSLGYQMTEDHQVQLNILYNAVAEDTAVISRDPATKTQDNIADTDEAIRHRARLLGSAQLRGQHKVDALNRTEINWQVASNYARQYDPDTRFFSEERQGVNRRISNTPGSEPQRIWQEVIDTSSQGSVDFKVPFRLWTETEGYVKFGAFAEDLKRDFDIDRYRYVRTAPAGVITYPVATTPEDRLLSDLFFDPNFNTVGVNGANQQGWTLRGNNVNVIDYNGKQQIEAIYFMAEVPLLENLKVNGGIRLESTKLQTEVVSAPQGFGDVTGDGVPEDFITIFRRQVDSATVNSIDVPIDTANTNLSENFIQPAFGIVYEPLQKMFFRANYGKTTARPTFRELAPTLDRNVEDSDGFFGNPLLVMSEADNFDFRAEWFPRDRTMVSIGAFYKYIQNPIETLIASSAGGTLYTKENFPSGEVKGFEVEARQGLDLFHEMLSPFSVGANFAWIESRVVMPDYLQRDLSNLGSLDSDRPLTGTPAYLANANLTYDNPGSRTSVGVFYTLQGETLLAGAGADGVNGEVVPGRVAMPFGSLNFSITQGITEHWTISFKAKNVLDPEIEVVERLPNDDDVLYKSVTKGVDLSLGVKYKW